jgi:hypothetical protein
VGRRFTEGGGVGGVSCGGGVGAALGAASMRAAASFPVRRTQAPVWVEAALRSISRARFESCNSRILFEESAMQKWQNRRICRFHWPNPRIEFLFSLPPLARPDRGIRVQFVFL